MSNWELPELTHNPPDRPVFCEICERKLGDDDGDTLCEECEKEVKE